MTELQKANYTLIAGVLFLMFAICWPEIKKFRFTVHRLERVLEAALLITSFVLALRGSHEKLRGRVRAEGWEVFMIVLLLWALFLMALWGILQNNMAIFCFAAVPIVALVLALIAAALEGEEK